MKEIIQLTGLATHYWPYEQAFAMNIIMTIPRDMMKEHEMFLATCFNVTPDNKVTYKMDCAGG